MFKILYRAGHHFAETTLPKAFRSKSIPEEDKKTNAGFIGMALGNFLEVGAIIGIGVAAATVLLTPGGLTATAFFGMSLLGTALAGVGAFGKGMVSGGDMNSGGFVSGARGLRNELVKTIWNDLRGRHAEPASTFRVKAKPAKDFSKAVANEATAEAVAKPAAPTARAPENK